MPWVPVDKQFETKSGDTYRITFQMHGNYDSDTVQKIKDTLYGATAAVDSPLNPFKAVTGFWVIQSVDTNTEELSYDHVPTQPLGQSINFNLVVIARRTGGGTPLIEVLGPILALLGLLIIGAVVVGWTAEKLDKGPVGQAIGNLFSMPVLLIAGGILALWFLGKSKLIGGK